MKAKFNAGTGEWEVHMKCGNVPVVVEGFRSKGEALRFIALHSV